MHAAPKPDSDITMKPTMLRLRNWRRVTPRVSGSGGTKATGAADGAGTMSAPPERASTADCS